MAGILSVATNGSNDPTKASLAFITAAGAIDAGEDVSIVLLAEAAYLAKPGVVDSIHGVGFAPLKEYVQKVVDAKIDVYV